MRLWSAASAFQRPHSATDGIVKQFEPKSLGRLAGMHARGTDDTVKTRDHYKGAQFDSAGAGCLGTLEESVI